jgi:polysaccharide export outer membrane protein
MRVLILILLFLVVAGRSEAQTNTGQPLDNDVTKTIEKEKTGLESINMNDRIPFERSVNPATYVCGAGDMLALSLVLPVNFQYTLMVGGDGTLIIPRVGAVKISGRTLQQAEEDIFSILEKKYSHVKGALTLAHPRVIYVTIKGDVEAPGLYTVTSATPVSVALYMANIKPEGSNGKNVLQQPASKEQGYFEKLSTQFFGDDYRGKRSARRVFVRHNDGKVQTADLVRYSALREDEDNPMLREGDEIVVPAYNPAQPDIGVYGAVRRPGEYEFTEGDNVGLLMNISLGLNPDMRPATAQLVRKTADGADESLPLPLEGIETNQTPLQPGDRIIVKGRTIRNSSGKIAVKGEVQMPGVYPIIPGKTMLSEVIAQCGGFSSEAFPSLSEMYRPMIGTDGYPLDMDREYNRNLRLSMLTMEDSNSYRLESRSQEGIVSVDFYKLFVKHDLSADVPVFDGEIIIIPKNTNTVRVIGMVRNGGYVAWKQGAKLDYYIEKVNGYLEDASKSRVRIIKENTRAWLDPDETEIEPGDLIWVNRNQQLRASNTTEVLGMLASVIAALAGITSLAVSVLRK